MFFGKNSKDGAAKPQSGEEELEEKGAGEQTAETETAAENVDERSGGEREETSDTEETPETPEPEDDFAPAGGYIETEQKEAEEEPERREQTEERQESEEERAARLEARRRVLKKAAVIGGITVGGLAVIYFAGAAFYSSHFFWGTRIGSYNCSNMSLPKAEAHITKGIDDYTIDVYEDNGVVEYIRGAEVGLAAVSRESIDDIKRKQNPFMWFAPGERRVLPMEVEISLNDELLKGKIGALRCVAESNVQMDGAYAGVYYDETDKVYHVKDDGTHRIVSERALFDRISAGMKGLYAEIHLDEEGLYGGLEKDDRMNDTLWSLNSCLNAVVTYQRGDSAIVLDGGTIHTWLSVDESYAISLNDAAVAAFVSDLAGVYDTVGGTRTFIGSGGAEVSVSGGDYGWRVNQAAESEELKNIILAGQPVTREPIYSRRGGSHGAGNDLPNTYVEVSIAAQHLWYYKDGELIISSDVVTGNPYAGNGTHTGIYYLKYKERNATLVGDNYETPVSFWMPFNGGEGLHDATWRGGFGGRIYMGGGSHGCVNCPYGTAQKLYEYLQPGDPVIVY